MTSHRRMVYSPYQRFWHWFQAAAILVLAFTGLVIHSPDLLGAVPFELAVRVHNALGLLLVANAVLGLFYYVTTGTIQQYLPGRQDFLHLAVRQASYYLRGMFRGESHPLAVRAGRRLNPLQQITYLAILNVLLPLQVATGLLMWGGQSWPAAVASLGGLGGLALVHTLGAWLFVAFLLAHVYLITTGPTLLAHLKTMVVGYEDESEPPPSAGAVPARHEPEEVLS